MSYERGGTEQEEGKKSPPVSKEFDCQLMQIGIIRHPKRSMQDEGVNCTQNAFLNLSNKDVQTGRRLHPL